MEKWMTVQELIDALNKVEDKSLPLVVDNYADDEICGNAIYDCIEFENDRVVLSLRIV